MLELRIIFFGLLMKQMVVGDLIFTPHEVSVEVNQTAMFYAVLSDNGVNEILKFNEKRPNITMILNNSVTISKGETKTILLEGVNPGHVVIAGSLVNRSDVNFNDAVVKVTVGKSSIWIIVSNVMGWMYFVAWSISFYPQIFENWRRKSVVGLNFDFLTLNFLGFFLYSAFNVGFYAVEPIKESFHQRYPFSVNPVQINDLVFSVHALIAVGATLIQCFIYERENQKVSYTAKALFAFYGLFLGISIVLSGTSVLEPIDFLYHCSYVKLSITFIKYIPQAYMNYKKQSTVGWSVGNIFLDFVGGLLSMAQMIVNSYNYDDWDSIFGDITKFGLGMFSVCFDIFFLVQHYVLYRRHSSSQS